MAECSLVNKHSSLAGHRGPCLSGLIWTQQIGFMTAPFDHQSGLELETWSAAVWGHTVTTETVFKSSHINGVGVLG